MRNRLMSSVTLQTLPAAGPPIRYQVVHRRKPMEWLPPLPATILEPTTYQVVTIPGLSAGVDYDFSKGIPNA